MNLNLFCPLCMKEQSEALNDKNVVASDVPTPMSRRAMMVNIKQSAQKVTNASLLLKI
jgi:hypothetical protein